MSGRDNRAVTVLAGAFAVAGAVLVLGGALKVLSPDDTATALRLLGLPVDARLVRAGAVFELGVGACAVAFAGWALAALVAISYLVFAAFVVTALARGAPIASCGCLGRADTPPSVVHVVVDLAAVGIACAAAVVGVAAVPDVVADDTSTGVVLVVAIVLGIAATFAALTTLPRALRRPGQVVGRPR